jgi:hypothetical protein
VGSRVTGTIKKVGIALPGMGGNGKTSHAEQSATVLLSHAGASTQRPEESVEALEVQPGEVLLVGRHPSVDRLDTSARALIELVGDVREVTLALPPTSCVSRAQLVLWMSGGQLLVGTPAASQPVLIQPWGHPARSTALAMMPAGEPVGPLSTLWLPWSDATAGYAGGRWRMGVITASVITAIWERQSGVHARSDTFGAMAGHPPSLTDNQLEAVLERFGDYLHFLARTPAPSPRPYRRLVGHQRKTVEHRLDAVREAIRTAYGLPKLGADQRLLQLLLECGALSFADVIARAPEHNIQIAERLIDDDPLGAHPPVGSLSGGKQG